MAKFVLQKKIRVSKYPYSYVDCHIQIILILRSTRCVYVETAQPVLVHIGVKKILKQTWPKKDAFHEKFLKRTKEPPNTSARWTQERAGRQVRWSTDRG